MAHENKDLEHFTETTRKEARWWDWLGRVLPLTALVSISVAHFFDYPTIRDTLINASIIIFFTLCAIWWWWVIRKIVSTINYMRSSQQNFLALTKELRKFKRDLKKDDSNR